jgi:FMN phosphatase YigB (HAD superfamily)
MPHLQQPNSGFHWQAAPLYRRLDWRSAKLLSLDIFDTIVHRASRVPTDVFFEVGRRALAAGLVDPGVTPDLFSLTRVQVERRVRQAAQRTRKSSEVTLSEIWQAAPAFLGPADSMLQLELETEFGLSFSNPYTISLAREARAEGIRVCFTSDTYFPRSFLVRLLEKAGLAPHEYDGLVISCEHDANKHSGTLFPILFATFPELAPHEILHVGDDLVADFTQPTRKGVRAVHLSSVHFDTELVQRNLLVGVEAVEDPLASLARLGGMISEMNASREAFFFELGASRIGHLMAAYCAWVVEDASRRGIRLLCPVMREGALFSQLLRQAANALDSRVEIRELYASRKAAMLPAIGQLDAESFARYRARRHFTLRDLVTELGLPEPSEPLSTVLDEPLGEISDTSALNAYVESPEVREASRARSTEERSLLVEYVREVFGEADSVALVDLGPAGNTLCWVADCLEDDSPIRLNYLFYSTRDATDNLARGHLSVSFLGASSEAIHTARVIHRSHEVLETLLTSRYPTTTGYVRSPNGCVEPRVERVFKDESQDALVRAFESGALSAARHLAHILRNVDPGTLFVASGARARALHMQRLIEMPTWAEARELGSLRYDDNAGVSTHSQICSEQDHLLVEAEGPRAFLTDARRRWGFGARGVRWPQGVVTRVHPDFLVQLHRETFNDGEHRLVCLDLVGRVMDDGHDRATVYGGGKLGFELVELAQRKGLRIDFVVDSDSSLHGSAMLDVPVVALEHAMAEGSSIMIVASVAFARPIVQTILAFSKSHGQPEARIYSVLP